MRFQFFLIAGAAALSLSACVVVETGSTIGTGGTGFGGFQTGGTATPTAPNAPAAFTPPSLRDQLSGGLITNSLSQRVLRPDGTLQGSGTVLGITVPVTGTWSATGTTLCIETIIGGTREGRACGPAELRGSQLYFDSDSNGATPAEVYAFRR